MGINVCGSDAIFLNIGGKMAMLETRTRAFACPTKYFQGIGEFDLLENYTAMFGKKAFYTIDGFLYDN